ncbi:hypothetical protein [Metabacillus arenae]|uniref:Uncharacterized protein n=1 Tax=Metabacillus arenae TaxID=2771434 RepID=A0A926NIX0_9BACI|nr:hypothetical protein [Metabacillus arenae]MBD1381910.1 hypothetical protein [Metabacillus arenae]
MGLRPFKCCVYCAGGVVVQTICVPADDPCPEPPSGTEFAGSVPVTSCDECFSDILPTCPNGSGC